MKMHKKLINSIIVSLFVVALMLAQPAVTRAAALIAILVADTASDDIGEGVSVDLSRMSALVEDISANTGLELQKIILAGTNLTRSGVANAVDQLIAGMDDVIVFYYSGHGARPLGKTSNWPDLAFDDGFVDFGQILDVLQRKQPRFLLALADSCNNYLTPELKQRERKLLPSAINQESYRQLFLRQSGSVLACGSQPGEVSYSHRTTGGFFTSDFLNKLTATLLSGQPSWQEVQTSEITAFGSYTQHPYYEIRVQPFETQPVAQPTPTPVPTQVWVPPVIPTVPQPAQYPTPTPRPRPVATPTPEWRPPSVPAPSQQVPVPSRPTRPTRPIRPPHPQRQRLLGSWKVEWDKQGVPFEGILTMEGRTGLLRLVYFDERYQHDVVVDQDIELIMHPSGSVILQGSDPRLPPDNIPHPQGYAPDSLYGRFFADTFEIERICDESGYCTSDVQIEALPVEE
ncbi:hypothetical protein U27_01556 [Candidatus Vecturithrix granuli]|uniref:Peptidase C14 caspase domain-containing protein n=1 Tax=Vecturithrix granuli TaxID=1499967 RepID=A0A081CAQ0_VECG1|nr:hypothetical protein U27_01556 [Candidatus Vecturithrix granuli]